MTLATVNAHCEDTKMSDLIAIQKIAQWEKLKTLVLDSVSSPITKRVYNMALDEFLGGPAGAAARLHQGHRQRLAGIPWRPPASGRRPSSSGCRPFASSRRRRRTRGYSRLGWPPASHGSRVPKRKVSASGTGRRSGRRRLC